MNSAVDFEAIRMEVARRHNLLLGPDDPILATVTINELVLGAFLERAEAAASQLEEQGAARMAQEIAAVKESAEKMIVGAAEYISKHVHAAAVDSERRISSGLQERLERAERVSRQAEAVRTPTVIAAVVACAAALLAIGVVLGAALR